MNSQCTSTNVKWSDVREYVRKHGITEQQFYSWLIRNTTPPVVEEVLHLIVNHVYHSEEDYLIAPPHLRIDKNGNYPFLHHHK